MAATTAFTIKTFFNLTRFEIDKKFMKSTHVTMGSDKYICVRETGPGNIVLIDVTDKQTKPSRINIEADSALVNPNSELIAVKAKVEILNKRKKIVKDKLQILDMDGNELKSYLMPKQIVFWKWITPNILGLVTRTEIYHWSIDEGGAPQKMYNRTNNQAIVNNQIINYDFDPSQRWLVLKNAEGTLQFFNVEYCEPHTNKNKNKEPSVLLSLTSAPQGNPSADYFPIAMQMSYTKNLIHVITRIGVLYAYDLETAIKVYKEKFSQLPILVAIEASSLGGFYAIDEQGQVFLATINEKTIVRTYVRRQRVELDNFVLGVDLDKRDDLILPSFVDLGKVQKRAKLISCPATQDVSGLVIDRSYVVSKCRLSEKMEINTPLSSRWDRDRLIEEYQTYIRDVIDDLMILELEYNITEGCLSPNLIGIDVANRARILEVQNPNFGWSSPFSQSLKDQLKNNLIPNMLGNGDELHSEEAKKQLLHIKDELNETFSYEDIFYDPILYTSLERFYFPLRVIILIERQFRKSYDVQEFPTWDRAFRSRMKYEFIDIKSTVMNSKVTHSKLFIKVFQNRKGEYSDDLVGVLKFMRNVINHVTEFSAVDKSMVERDLTKLFPSALREIYKTVVAMNLDLRQLSKKSIEIELEKEQCVVRQKLKQLQKNQ